MTIFKKAIIFTVTIVFILSISNIVKACGDDIYVVKKGDILSLLATKYKVTVQQLESANGLKSDKIQVGQTLVVPMLDKNGKHVLDGEPLASNEVIYTIQKGDSLKTISKKFSVTEDSIIKKNHLQSKNLIIGRWLTIELNNKKSSVTPTKSTEPNYVVYKVQSGDTLSGLALKFNTSTLNLKQLNTMNSDVIFAGQTLKVPSTNIVTENTIVSGVEDNTSIELMVGNTPKTFIVGDGNAQLYEKLAGKKVTVAFIKGSNTLVSIKEL